LTNRCHYDNINIELERRQGKPCSSNKREKGVFRMDNREKLSLIKDWVSFANQEGVFEVALQIRVYNEEKTVIEDDRVISGDEHINFWDDLRKMLIVDRLKFYVVGMDVCTTRVVVGDIVKNILTLDNSRQHIELEAILINS